MNALGNSQYEEFATRLAESGLRVALYTGDTPNFNSEALSFLEEVSGRTEPFDSELLSREAIRGECEPHQRPDILMTNYQMLELLLTRFEDKRLFPTAERDVLRFLVLDELHTYSGRRGADVACLVRRLKQHTGTVGKIRCIGTSATVQSGSEEEAKKIIADFAAKLFGESFVPEGVIGESYVSPEGVSDEVLPERDLVSEELLEAFDGEVESTAVLVEALTGHTLSDAEKTPRGLGVLLKNQATAYFLEKTLLESPTDLYSLAEQYQEAYRPEATDAECRREVLAALYAGSVAEMEIAGTIERRFVPKLHAFFSQGREITACLTEEGPHLNDRGEITCPTCAVEGGEIATFPLHFCRACGQEFYGI